MALNVRSLTTSCIAISMTLSVVPAKAYAVATGGLEAPTEQSTRYIGSSYHNMLSPVLFGTPRYARLIENDSGRNLEQKKTNELVKRNSPVPLPKPFVMAASD